MENKQRAHPDFVVFGSPKCASSALSRYLADHPSICFSDPKEVNFFNVDFMEPEMDYEEYVQKYFAGARPNQLTGEGSVRYIFSDVAADELMKVNPKARLIVMIRNPIDMFVSLYHQNYAGFEETARTPEKAWRQQPSAEEAATPAAKLRRYGHICSHGAHLERLYTKVPQGQIQVIFYDDFQQSPGSVWRSVLEFLELPNDGRTDFPVVNKSRASSEWLRLLLRVLRRIKKTLGIKWGIGNTAIVQRIFFGKKKELSESFRAELQEFFAADVKKLQTLTGRDLRSWLG